MKKFFAIALIAISVTACNSGSDKKEGEDKDTTKTEAPVTPAPDTTKPAADTTKPVADTAAQPK